MKNRKLDLTVASYIFRPDNHQLLLIHHKKLKKWLPVGGHIDKNESPDEAALREIKEETGLEATHTMYSPVNKKKEIRTKCSVPFDANIHAVGDHDHYGLFYLCLTFNPQNLNTNKKELNEARWFSKEDLNKIEISENIKEQALLAFHIYNKKFR